nr:unnamed protein product [Callosobruchus analis]
MCSKNAQRKSC